MTVVTKSPRLTAPPDPTFAAWLDGSLVWLADRGMGYLPVREQPYDDRYFEKYVGYSKTSQGRRLTVSRIEFVQRCAYSKIDVTTMHAAEPEYLHGPPRDVIDIGIGCGDFIERAAETWQVEVYGYDVNRPAVEWLTDRGLYRDPYAEPFSVATFWDSLEHIPDVHRVLANVTDWVFASLPVVPGDGPPPADWRHLRRDEHTWYFTRDGFIGWMAAQGWVCVEHNTAESIAGRGDIGSFAFRRAE